MKLTILLSVVCMVLASGPDDKSLIDSVKSSRDFTGKVVLVTGSSSGIGLEITKLFAGLGAQSVITGRKPQDVEKAAKEVQALSPKNLKPLQVVADLTNATEVAELVNQTVTQLGRLDVLVNDAGVYLMDGIESDKFFTDFETYLSVGVRAALQLIRQSISALSKTNGTIINISSVFTSVPQENMLGYEVSKQALEMATKVLAQELGPKGITINTIRPGAIDSHPQYPPNPNFIKKTPLGRIGYTADVAKGCVFLASSDAEFITGSILDIDGGLAVGIGGRFAQE